MAHSEQVDVLIVGAGIAGSALGCALRGSGLRVLLLDKSIDALDTARGDSRNDPESRGSAL